jgi:hypothetical protein
MTIFFAYWRSMVLFSPRFMLLVEALGDVGLGLSLGTYFDLTTHVKTDVEGQRRIGV